MPFLKRETLEGSKPLSYILSKTGELNLSKTEMYLNGFEPHLLVVTNQPQMNDIYDPHYLWIYLHIIFSIIVLFV